MGKSMRGQHGRLHKVAAKRRSNAPSKARGARWVEIGGVVGGLAAGIGLIFTGIVTYYGVRTSQQQLEQQEEEENKEISAQADKVDIRKEGFLLPFEDPAFVVENYSRQTIRNVLIPVAVLVDGKDKVYLISAGTVPPCTTRSVSFAELRKASPTAFKNLSAYSSSDAYFTDSRGQRWKQTGSGTEKSEDEEVQEGKVYAMFPMDAGRTDRLPDC
ncbi:hypothetical protein AB0A05_35565 [Streptomyces sp. NPDC046374]|uniref:hypothetical protein n=1 Tax=Streptomyces sp. NPDC046374 TaxID=3154917 RepID=UPI0033FB951A